MKQFITKNAASGALKVAVDDTQRFRDTVRLLVATATTDELQLAFGGGLPAEGQDGGVRQFEQLGQKICAIWQEMKNNNADCTF